VAAGSIGPAATAFNRVVAWVSRKRKPLAALATALISLAAALWHFEPDVRTALLAVISALVLL